MNVKKVLAAALCLVMVLTVLPAKAEAATGDFTPEGIILFEEDFNYTSLDDAKAGGWNDSASLGKYASFDGDCMKISATANKAGDVYLDYLFADMGIPYSYSGLPVSIRFDFVVSAAKRDYQIQILTPKNSDGADLAGSLYTVTAGSLININKTASEEFETLSVIVKPVVNNKGGFLDSFKLRVGARRDSASTPVTGTATDYVQIDSVKITLLASTVDGATPERLQNYLANEVAYAKLSADMTIDGSLTLGENAVLDLNGHKLTATTVNGGKNAVIIDSSANRSGKLDTASLILENENNPQLPLKTAVGYIFTQPELGPDRAFMVEEETNAEGFVMDFRPGFGEAGGNNIRTTYLEGGNSGIKMEFRLSWTDIYGNQETAEEALTTDIFDGMYESEFTRGRLIVNGTTKYSNISVGITLKSCGVVYEFAPVVYNNTYVTTHFAADFEKGTVSSNYSTLNVGQFKSFNGSTVIAEEDDHALNTLGTNDMTFAEGIATGAGKILNIEFDLKTDNGMDYFYVRASKGGYVTVIGAGGARDNNSTYGNLFTNASSSEFYRISKAGEYVHIHMTIDLETGRWSLYRDGVRLQGAIHNDVQGLFDGMSNMYLRVESGVHYFDNLLIYTINN